MRHAHPALLAIVFAALSLAPWVAPSSDPELIGIPEDYEGTFVVTHRQAWTEREWRNAFLWAWAQLDAEERAELFRNAREAVGDATLVRLSSDCEALIALEDGGVEPGLEWLHASDAVFNSLKRPEKTFAIKAARVVAGERWAEIDEGWRFWLDALAEGGPNVHILGPGYVPPDGAPLPSWVVVSEPIPEDFGR